MVPKNFDEAGFRNSLLRMKGIDMVEIWRKAYDREGCCGKVEKRAKKRKKGISLQGEKNTVTAIKGEISQP
ncbi:hypothetical protein A2379_00745 [Candidatus Amesbacteria bacterium RIFOXYB1_FULL_47_13]|nr:MAG: hypothetical protein A2379_00745 [Candidatus Amesbacteria bacterium RIFOXYB1_FULL_47_13]HBC72985.1 hypothetical protein [Candidatus Amesbacteria bacterium]